MVLLAGALSSLTGCGFFKGLTNPDVAWAMGEPTTMSVIVRRTELASGIADEVDRLVIETPVDEAAQKALELKRADLEKRLEVASTEPIYEGQPLRVVPAEAWFPTLAAACAQEDGHDTLVGMLEGDVEDRLGEVMAQGRKIAKLEAEIETLETKRDEDGASEAQRSAAEEKIAKLEAEIDELEAGYEPKVDELLASVRERASQVPDKAKERMTPIVLNLLEAVEDARIANDAAMVRYPMAMPSLTTDLQQAATRFVADVIEEKSGHRPATKGIAPQISLEGTDVKLGLNGVPAEALGELDMGEVVSEVTDRTQAYAGRAFTLLADASETEDRLAFQADLLTAWRDGLAVAAGAPGHVDISDVEVAAKPAPPPGSATKGEEPAGPTANRTLGGLRIERCATTTGAVVARKTPAKESPVPTKAPSGKAPAKVTKAAKRPAKPAPAKKGGPTQTAASEPGGTEWIDLPAGGSQYMQDAP